MAYCGSCGRVTVKGVLPGGKVVLLDPMAPVYRVVEKGESEIIVDRNVNAMVAHKNTCPAGQWVAKKKDVSFGGKE